MAERGQPSAPRAERRAERSSMTVLFDAECAVCRLSVRMLRRLDWRRRLAFRPLQGFTPSAPDDPPRHVLRLALHVRDAAGRWHRGGHAALLAASAVPILAPLALLGRLPGMRRPVEAAYRVVADHRTEIGRLLRIR
jgi:predicted DCC family thiol-disulfide oxidoreductase YuxK